MIVAGRRRYTPRAVRQTLDIPLAVSFCGIAEPSDLRAQIEWAAGAGYRAVALNGAAPDCRARDLGRSARRDIASLLRRCELVPAGIDLWLPPKHFTDPQHADRALNALLDAIDLAADLAELTEGDPVLSAMLPAPCEAGGMLNALIDRAAGRGARIADHRWPRGDDEPMPSAGAPIGIGLDPASIFIAEGRRADPAAAVLSAGAGLVSARLSDADEAGRCQPGVAGGRLDVLGYCVALATAGYRGRLVVDARGLGSPTDAAGRWVKPRP